VQASIDDGIAKGDMGRIWLWAALIIVAGVVRGVTSGGRRYWAFKEARWAEADLRHQMFAHLQALHFAYHDDQQTGQLMSRANTDLQQIVNFTVMIPLTIANLVTVLIAAVIMFVIDPLLALLAVCSLPLLNIFAKKFSSSLHPVALDIQQESAELAGVVEESVSGVRVVKGFGAEPVLAGRLRHEASDLWGATMSAARIRALYQPLLDVLPNIGLILVLFYGGLQVIHGHLEIGTLVAFSMFVAMIVWPLRMLGSIVAQGQSAAACAQRVQEVLDAVPVVVDPPDPATLPDTHGGPRGRVTFEGVSFGYGNGDLVLDDFNLEVAAGESVALVGSTGSGKSTVAKLIPRFYDPQAGRVLIDGVDVASMDVHEVRKAVGIVFEDTFLFSDSVAGNIAFAEPEAPLDRIRWAARLAGADEFVEALPEAYDTEIGEQGFSLSGGQRQRVAIARAILSDPRVLILDDATSAVDPSKEQEIRDALGEVMGGRTTIVIAHRPGTIALADKVVFIDGGRVAAIGGHHELLATNEAYRSVLAAASLAEEVS
jgi:ATP-binding cassette subfamily B protein